MNPVGAVAAVSAFLAIWFGHVAVRKIEFASRAIWLPAAVFLGSGLLAEWLSTQIRLPAASIAFGIVGVTLMWDALELRRQARRVRRGHAPANPANPRHARMLAAPDSQATTLDLLKRGRAADNAESGGDQPSSLDAEAV